MSEPGQGKTFSPGAIVVDEEDGEQYVKLSEGSVTLSASDIEVGAVEIKDGSTDNRATVSSGGRLQVELPAGGGGLTDAELRATPVPVEQATSVTVDAGTGPFPVSDNGGSLTVDSTQLPAALGSQGALKVEGVASGTAQPVSGTVTANAGSGPFPVSDNAGSLTVDAPVGTPVFTRLSDGTAALTTTGGRLAVDASGVAVPVTDNSGSLTVDAPVGTPVFVRLSDGSAALIGQKAMTASVPVVLASDQTVIPVNGDIDHDVANTNKNIQIAGNARAVDDPPTKVDAVGDRARIWVDRFGAQVVRRRKIRESYTAVFRLAEAAARLDQTFTLTANTNKQYATLHHTASATKELQLMKCVVWVTGATAVAPQGIIELRELSSATPPATGNPAITGRPRRIGTGAHEATALYLPTTQGSEAAANSPLGHHVFDDAVSVATAAFQHPQQYETGGIVLLDTSKEDDQVMAPTAPVGVYGGWAVTARLTGATALRLTVMMIFTEEIP